MIFFLAQLNWTHSFSSLFKIHGSPGLRTTEEADQSAFIFNHNKNSLHVKMLGIFDIVDVECKKIKIKKNHLLVDLKTNLLL